MKVIDFGKGFSGKIGGVVYYEMNGKLYARSAPRQRTREELENVSETVKGINRRFKVIQQLYSLYRKHVSPDIWRLAAKEQGKMAHNLNAHNLLLYHTEDTTLSTRKQSYTAEAAINFTGGIYVPDDLEVIDISASR